MALRFPTAGEVVRAVYGVGYVVLAIGVLAAALAAVFHALVPTGLGWGALALGATLAVGYGALAVAGARAANWCLEADAPLATLRAETTRVRRATELATDGDGSGGDP